MITGLDTPAAFEAFVREHSVAAVYFGSAGCGICEVLWPKLEAMLSARFAQLALAKVDIGQAPVLAAAQRVFTVPVIVVCFEGRESLRKAGAFSPVELADDIARPYALLVGEGER